VFDLSIAHAPTRIDGLANSPSSPDRKVSADLGDLRSLSLKPWSRSAEELGKFSVSAPSSPLANNFHDRIQQYRTGSPSHSHSPTVSHPQSQHPFPTFATTSSSADLSSAPSSPVSLSPSPATPPSSAGVPMLHVRSHSFTPKLPSKLSASKIGPPSPSRKTSNASERLFDLASMKDKLGSTPPMGRGTPSLAIGGGNRVYAPSPTMYDNIPAPTGDTQLLPPPKIVEPPQTESPDSSCEKRVSQITFHSGFVNRATDFTIPNSRGTLYGQPVTAKGWKPSKLILRGAKLQFYKPRNDRIAEVKELFPVGIVPADEEEGEASQEDEGSADKTKLDAKPQITRRKRAFWGRRTHPDLVLDTHGAVGKGTLEALVHETVFATTFSSPQDILSTDDVQPSSTQNADTAAWQDFALSILFALPLTLGADKFEFEFVRCCTYLISGADADTKEGSRARVAWLAREYLRFHGKPVDEAAWNDFQRDTIPNALQTGNDLPESPTLPTSASMQALYARSPMQLSSSPNANTVSPNVDTFSPRPDHHRGVMSLHDTLAMDHIPAPNMTSSPSKSPLNASHRASGSGNSQDISLALLDRDGFTRDVLFRFKPQDIAHSLFVFHRSLLEILPQNLIANDCLVSIPASIERHSSSHLLAEPGSSIGCFLGSEARLHWLTKLVLFHVLMLDSPTSVHPTLPGDLSSRTSRTYTRSEVVSTWVRIGELCRVTGDECSWRAIFNALCSRPVARLGKTWRRVDLGLRAIVETWAAKAGNNAVENKQTFWGGDACEKIRASIDKAKLGEGDSFAVLFLRAAKNDFEGFRTTFSLCPRKPSVGTDGRTKVVQTLLDSWRLISSSEECAGSLGRKFVRHVFSPLERCWFLIPFTVSTSS
jgi:GTPase-activating protein BEM2